ncbi:InlB B-repeat-containing protein, partial [Thiospirillum jenense]
TITRPTNGAITGSNINCGSAATATDCDETYSTNPTITLTATANPGYVFGEWTNCTPIADNPLECQITIDGAQTVSASFIPTYLLTITRPNRGTISGNGINCGSSNTAIDCSETYLANQIITLTAAPDIGYVLNSWGNCTAIENTPQQCQIAMTAMQNVSANFTPISLSVSMSIDGEGHVSTTPAGINCGINSNSCSATYPINSTIELTATPGATATFAGWDGVSCPDDANPCTLTLTTTAAIIARFAPVPYTLTVVSTGSGYITSDPAGINCGGEFNDCSKTYDANTAVTLTATPTATATFTGWSGGGCSGTDNCTVTLDAAKNVTA